MVRLWWAGSLLALAILPKMPVKSSMLKMERHSNLRQSCKRWDYSGTELNLPDFYHPHKQHNLLKINIMRL